METALLLVLSGLAGGDYSRSVAGASATPDFNLEFHTSSVFLTVGDLKNLTLTAASVQGFAGNVLLETNVKPFLGPVGGLTALLNTTSLSLGAGDSRNATAALSAISAGTYVLNVTGTSGSLSHTILLAVQISLRPDFLMVVSPKGLAARPGDYEWTYVYAYPNEELKGMITLNATVSPPGPRVTFDPVVVGGEFPSQVTIRVGNNVPVGNYNITIIGTSGRLSRNDTAYLTVVSVFVQPIPSSPPAQGLDPLLLYTVTGLAGVVAFLGLLVVWRRLRRRREPTADNMMPTWQPYSSE